MERRVLKIPPKTIARRSPNLYRPEWNESESFYAWAKRFNAKNYWRVQHYFGSPEDSFGEIAFIFARLRKHYYGKLDGPQHFMALFTRTVNNKWNRFSVKDGQMRGMIDYNVDVSPQYNDDGMMTGPYVEPSEDATAELMTSIGELPPELLHVFTRLLESPAELIDFLFSTMRDPGTGRLKPSHQIWSTPINQRLRQVFSLSSQFTNIVERLRELCDPQK